MDIGSIWIVQAKILQVVELFVPAPVGVLMDKWSHVGRVRRRDWLQAVREQIPLVGFAHLVIPSSIPSIRLAYRPLGFHRRYLLPYVSRAVSPCQRTLMAASKRLQSSSMLPLLVISFH